MKIYILSTFLIMTSVFTINAQRDNIGIGTSEFGYSVIPDTGSSRKEAVIMNSATFDVSPIGAAQYSIPINMPQGVGGLHPPLSINYNSQAPNGMMGIGFNIGGLSAITRGQKNIYYDGKSQALTYSTNDAYYLDGKRMILSSGKDLQEGAIYHLEDDPLTKIIAHGIYNNTTANTWFEIEHSNGMKYYYGHTASARQSYTNNKKNPRIYSWYLDYTEDALGNYINYSYLMSNNTIYPNTVSYGKNKNIASGGVKNSIHFSYSERNDKIPFFIEGKKGEMNKLLKSITTQTESTIYRTYNLNYSHDNEGLQYNRLTSIIQSNSLGEKLTPIEIVWNVKPLLNYSPEHINVKEPPDPFFNAKMTFDKQYFSTGDFNGDGITDIIGLQPVQLGSEYKTAIYTYYTNLDKNGKPTLDRGNMAFIDAAISFKDWETKIEGVSSSDIKGEGKDVLIIPILINIKGLNPAVDFHIVGESINRTIVVPITKGKDMVAYAVGDIDNNAKSEIITLEKDHTNNVYYGRIIAYEKSGGRYFKETPLHLTLPNKPEHIFIDDYNGNGLKDLMVVYESGYTIYWNQGNSVSSSSFTDQNKTTGSSVKTTSGKWTMLRSGDFNGDGLKDFVYNDKGSPEWYFALNNGDGTFTKTIAANIFAFYANNLPDRDKFQCHIVDFDNDGKDDIIINKLMLSGSTINSYSIYTYWMLSKGDSLEKIFQATSKQLSDGLPHRFLAGDFNGDGIVDIINYGNNCYSGNDERNDPSWRFYSWRTNPMALATSQAEIGKVRQITDGSTGVSINYASMTKSGFYTKEDNSSYPIIDLQLPLHAVESTTQYNGVADNIVSTYQYKGLKIHATGKGLLGLTSVTSKNETSKTSIETGIRARDEKFHTPKEIYSKTTLDDKISETRTTFKTIDKGNFKYITFPINKEDKDLDGNITTTQYKFNETYGYPEEEKMDFGNNMYKKVQYLDYVKVLNNYQPQLIVNKQKHSHDNLEFTLKTKKVYNILKGYQIQQISNLDTKFEKITNYFYDSYGNITTIEEAPKGIASIKKYSEYDKTGRFLTKIYTNPVTTEKKFTTDVWGNVIAATDMSVSSNILTTNYAYNGWGQLISTIYPDGNKSTITRGWEGGARHYYILEQSTSTPWVKTWYDAAGRETLVESIGDKNIKLYKETKYNKKGLISKIEDQTGDLKIINEYRYDLRDRITLENYNNQSSINYQYGNRKVITYRNNEYELKYKKTYDAWGNIITSDDPISFINYTYSSTGKPTTIQVDGEETFSMEYDPVGNQTKLIDPNAGITTYKYDALGRLISQVDGRKKETTKEYDVLGRLKSTTTDGMTTTYSYGAQKDNNYMLLIKEQINNNFISYVYDKYGRVITEKKQIEGEPILEYSYQYNTKGEVESVIYPENFKVDNYYDSYGNLEKVSIGTQTIWELMNNSGTLRVSKQGSTLTSSSLRNNNGVLTNLKTTKGFNVIHNMDFVFNDETRNLTSRTGMLPIPEKFEYDNIDRLITTVNEMPKVVNLEYSSKGNITSKSDVGYYDYALEKPHAVSAVHITNNEVYRGTQDITYTAFNKVNTLKEKIGNDNFELYYTYGTDQQRWKTELKKNNVLLKKTIFANNYERITENNQTKHLYYIDGADGFTALYVKQANQADKIYYPQTDYLGSIIKLIDNNGTEVFKASYDAWGSRTIYNNNFAFHRGFTGHEHLTEFRLIDMNGRMYDPVLGRFLSPDPYVQMPDFSQNFNRYSYALNNPLRYTDPSGEFAWLPFAIGFGINYAFHGVNTGDWGLSAVGSGVIGGFTAISSIPGIISTFNPSVTGFYGVLGGMSLANAAISNATQSFSVPISGTPFSISSSFGLGIGTEGLFVGLNHSLNYSNNNLNLSIGIGGGNNHIGWNGSVRYKGYGAGYGRTYYDASNIAGESYDSQIVGTGTVHFNHNSVAFSNDIIGDGKDRWRTNAVELNIDQFSIGTTLLTNFGARDGRGYDMDVKAPGLGLNKTYNIKKERGAWNNGEVHFAPAWIGYRGKNGNTNRIGYSHPMIQNYTQNLTHKTKLGSQNYYLNYNKFREGVYSYSGYNNPFSLWGH